ncbi:unnamed protein product [Prorocentrum cordatum]|uniref:Uncharacterized protein n=1 Tax=Prorocentrum cordatum TaxID=2364126 RepID=A0ABN9QM27_9DINO|nr:unnamed protein product [Polarella glacialis]
MSTRGGKGLGGGGGGKKREAAKPSRGALTIANVKKLRVGGEFCCGFCGCCDSGEAVADCQVEVCQKCWKRYLAALTTYGDISFVMEGVQDEGSTIHAEWQESGRIEDGVMRTFFSSDVSDSKSFEVKVTKPMIGLARQQVIAALGGHEPDKVGLRLGDLVDAEGNAFKGVLVPNPSRPYLEVDVSTTMSITRDTTKLKGGAQLFADQGKKAFEYECNDAKTEAHTLETLKAKGENYQRLLDSEKAKGSAACDDGASSTGDASTRPPDAPTSALSPGPSTMSAPALNPAALRDSVTHYSGEYSENKRQKATSGKAARKSPATAGATPEKSESYDLVQRRKGALNLERCWNGDAMGRGIRWARDAVAAILDKAIPGEAELADELDGHRKLAEAICGLMEKPIKNINQDKLDSYLVVIEGMTEDVRSAVKIELLKTRFSNMIFAGSCTASDLFRVAAPWNTLTDTDDATFKPRDPRVYTIDGSKQDKISMTDSLMIDVYNGHIANGKAGKSSLKRLCVDWLDWVDDNVVDDEDYDLLITSLITSWKALLSFINPKVTQYDDAVTALSNCAESKPGQASLRHLALLIRRPADYTEMKDEYHKFYKRTKELLPTVAMHEKNMKEMTVAAFVDGGHMLAALQTVAKLQLECRPGSWEGFEIELTAKLEEYVHGITVDKNYAKMDNTTQTQKLSEAKVLLQEAKKNLTSKSSAWQIALNEVGDAEAGINLWNANQGLASLAQALTADSLKDPAKRQSAIPVIDSALAAGGRSSEARAESAKAIQASVTACIGNHCESPESTEPYVCILKKILEAKWLTDNGNKELTSFVNLLERWGPIVEHKKQWETLGGDDGKRLEEASAKNIMVSLLSSLERVKEFMNDPTALMQLCDQAEPKSTGGASKDQPWHSTLNADASAKGVIELGKTTLLKINASEFKSMTDRLIHAMGTYNVWSTVINYTTDAALVDRAREIKADCLATMFSAKLIHDQIEHADAPTKLRRAANKIKQSVNSAGVLDRMPQQLRDMMKNMCSLKAA